MSLRLPRLLPVVLAVVAAGWVLARCAPPTDVLFLCEADGSCVQRDADGPYVCLEDGYCWPRSEVGPAGDGGDGGNDGGGDGGDGGDGGPTDGGEDAGADAAVPLVEIGPRCLTAAVCVEHPISGGLALNGVWGTSDRDLWAVGDKGTALHWDGARWQRVGVPATENARGVWGEGGRWYVVGDGMRLWWLDGGAFADIGVVGTANLVGVHGAGGQAYAVSDDGGIVSIQGTNATTVPVGFPAQWRSVWSLGPGQTFAVGRGGKAARIVDPTTVNNVSPAGMLVDFTDLGANAAGQLYAVGDAGEVWTFDAGQWVRLNAGGPGALAVAALDDGLWVAKTDAGEVGVYRLPGLGLETVTLPVADLMRDAWATGKTTWMVGDRGTILRTAEGADASVSFAPGGETQLIRAIAAGPDGTLYAAGEAETLLQRRGDQWLPLFDAGGPGGYRALFVGTDGLWTGGPAGIWRYADGGMILEHPTYGTSVNAFAGDVRRPLYAVGKDGLALYFDGGNWDVLTDAGGHAELLGATCYPDGGGLWVVGDGGTVLQRLSDGGTKMHYIIGWDVTYYDVWNSPTEGDIFLAGAFAYVTHWDGGPGGSWDPFFVPNGQYVRAIEGARSNALWLVGGGSIAFWDAGVVRYTAAVPGLNLVTAAATDGGVWAGGTNGFIVHQSVPP